MEEEEDENEREREREERNCCKNWKRWHRITEVIEKKRMKNFVIKIEGIKTIWKTPFAKDIEFVKLFSLNEYLNLSPNDGKQQLNDNDNDENDG